jgi:mono/diheme cytochrome c family protein/cytochrome c553
MNTLFRRPVLRAAFTLSLASTLSASALTPAEVTFFENNVRPLLDSKCYSCHSARAEKVKGGLRLDSREGVLAGGNNGPVIVAGKPDESPLIIAVRYANEDLQMPPKGKKLSDKEIATLEKWVQMGAPDPREAQPAYAKATDGKDHWAWQPLKEPPVPSVKNAKWVQNPVDNFILAKLESRSLKASEPADKRTLIRRAYFDLIGLPPTPEQVNAFLADKSPKAFEKIVDELLASPHYGERWARHWLDTARYSDTKGEVRRFREDPENPHAYLYRDYVIKSFNDDKPYNKFILEQIAADQLPQTKQDKSLLVALDFLTVGDRFMGMRNDVINDQIDVVTKGFLGLTVSCARCHDHKFDPIPQKDYYSLHGIFASSIEPKVLPVIEDIKETPDFLDYQQKLKVLLAEQDQLEAEFVELRRSPNRDRETIRQLQRQQGQNVRALSTLEMTHPGAPKRAMAVQDASRPKDSNLLIRGEAGNRGPVVPRQFLEVLSLDTRKRFTQGSGRLELAQAIIDPKNPMTARVMVNRVWLKHFGEGLVSTPDDFGTMAETPSHPELLDFLASEFIKHDWSLKQLHRTILLSATWQQSSKNNPRYAEVDPFNRLLWRQNMRRLEMEPIRDALLAISGVLEPALFGKPFDMSTAPQTPRRTIYARVDRQRLPESFVYFDFASPDLSTGRRHITTVPQQTLFFMNNPMVIELAKKLVAREEFLALKDDAARVERLYALLYQRLPEPDEVELGINFLNDMPVPAVMMASSEPTGQNQQRPKARPNQNRTANRKAATKAPLTAWQEYAQALLQANEFIFVQ